MSFHHSPRIATDGLVLCYDAGNFASYPTSSTRVGGTTIYDLSGRGNHGTFNGPIWWAPNVQGCLVFNGSSTWISTPLNIDANPVSVGAWFWANSLPAGAGGVVLTDNGGWDKGFGVISGNQWEIHSGDNQITTTKSGPVTSKWYYGCIVYTASSIDFYVNGETIYSGGAPGASSGANVEIGRAWYNGGAGSRWWNGNINIVHIYNRALTKYEAIANYYAMKSRF